MRYRRSEAAVTVTQAPARPHGSDARGAELPCRRVRCRVVPPAGECSEEFMTSRRSRRDDAVARRVHSAARDGCVIAQPGRPAVNAVRASAGGTPAAVPGYGERATLAAD
jgi:hypothetical protein